MPEGSYTMWCHHCNRTVVVEYVTFIGSSVDYEGECPTCDSTLADTLEERDPDFNLDR